MRAEGLLISWVRAMAGAAAQPSDAGAAQLRISEEWCRWIVDAANEGIWLVDDRARTAYVNRRMAEMLGCRAEELLGRSLYDFIDEVDRAGAEQHFARLKQGIHEPFDVRFRRPDGSELWALASTGALLNERGEYAGALCMITDVSERRQAERRLQESEQRYRSLFEKNPDAVFSVDLEGNFLSANPACERISGYSIEEILRTSFIPFLVPEEREKTLERFRRGLQGEPQNFETAITHKDGRRIELNVAAALIVVDGEVVGVYGIAKDITERKRLEEALRQQAEELRASEEAERRFSEQLMALSEVSSELSKAESLDDLCRRAVELGRSRLGFDRLGIWFVGEDRISAMGSFGVDEHGRLRDERGSRVTVTPGSVGGQVLLSKRPFALRAEGPVLDNRAAVVGRGAQATAGLWNGEEVIGFVSTDNLLQRQPITERQCRLLTLYASALGHLCSLKRAEEALQSSERRFRALIERSWDGIALFDAEGSVLYASPSTTRILGWSPDELVGRSCFDLMHPEDALRLREAFAQLLQRLGAGATAEYRYQHRDGSWIWIEGTVTNMLEEPPVRAIVANYRDITERKRLETELRQRADELAKADHAKDQFLAILAHELRNPLAPIRNAVQLLRQLGPDEPRLIRVREIIDRQVTHQAHLLDDLLNVSRIARGKVSLRRIRLDLCRVARDAAADHREVLEAAGLTLVLELPRGPIWVEGDPVRLVQTLGNLLQNAAKFTDPGGHVTVRIALEGETPFSWAAVTVRDTGIGMEPEMLSRVFETFTQADRSLDRSRGGLGLGLALVKGLVELHGGQVRAESEGPGRGSAVTFRLPLARERGASPAAPAAASGEMSRRRVLIVEDNRDAAETLRELLELAGHQVEVAHDGSTGLERARAFRPEVVLCDLGLPEMDGYAVAAELRRDPATAAARLIAVSGYGQEEDRQRSREAGFDLHLTKPVDPTELERLLAGT